MDTVTQIALGASVGEVTLGRQIGNRALMWGGICGLFPDLDILVPYGDVVKTFTYHRGPSHSLFVLTALAPFFVWLILRAHADTAKYRFRWYTLVYLALATHVLLDCLTVYGTQIFWPLGTPPVMWASIFVIDPAYSVPLFIGVLAALVLSRKSPRGHAVNTACLILSTLYLLWSIGVKLHVTNVALESLKQQHVPCQRILTVPAPFNTLLWRILVMDNNGYYEGFYSLFDKTGDIVLTHYPNNKRLLHGIRDHWPVKRLQWFTHGFYRVRQQQGDIVITDLRMGLEPVYIFQFKVGETGNFGAVPTHSKRVRDKQDLHRLRWVWERIWTAEPVMGGHEDQGRHVHFGG